MVATPLQALTMYKAGLIALDLDGTLLNSKKELNPQDEVALRKASELGVEIVPTTGRFYDAIPTVITKLPFINYVISINGAQIYDLRNNRVLFKAELPWQQGIEIMQYFDTLPLIYDCYMDNQAWMSKAHKEKIDLFAPDEHYRKMLHELRHPVEDLKAFLSGRKQDVQKIQFFCNDMPLRTRLLQELIRVFPNTEVSSSVINNVEITHFNANKGNALQNLASQLQIPIENTIAFGDGLNDLSMIDVAGIGIVMGNAAKEIKEQADYVTLDNDHCGVAAAIEKFCF